MDKLVCFVYTHTVYHLLNLNGIKFFAVDVLPSLCTLKTRLESSVPKDHSSISKSSENNDPQQNSVVECATGTYLESPDYESFPEKMLKMVGVLVQRLAR